MIKSEVMEIKKQFSPDRLCIVRAAGCYIGAEKGKAWRFSSPFYKIDEKEKHKYLSIYSKTLSGKNGEALLDISLSDGEEHEFLERLLKSELGDDTLNDILYDRIMEAYKGSNYYITAVCGKYDIPAKGTDKLKQGESDETYTYLLISVSPAKLSQPGLTYAGTEGEESVRLRITDWVIGAPDAGFLYPEFNERTSDHGEALSFLPKPELHPDFIGTVLGSKAPERIGTQKKAISEVIRSAAKNVPDQAETIERFYDALEEKAEEKDDERRTLLGKNEIAEALKKAGIDEQSVKEFEESTPDDLKIRKEAVVRPEHTEEPVPAAERAQDSADEKADGKKPIQIISKENIQLKCREIDGKKYFLIPAVSDVLLNGIIFRA